MLINMQDEYLTLLLYKEVFTSNKSSPILESRKELKEPIVIKLCTELNAIVGTI